MQQIDIKEIAYVGMMASVVTGWRMAAGEEAEAANMQSSPRAHFCSRRKNNRR